jgi:hypothetical protein
MKKLITTMKIVFYTAAVIVLITAGISCSKEPDYTGIITEDVLIAINENDYDGFMKHRPEQAKIDFTRADFEQVNNEVIIERGLYIAGTKKFWKTEEDDSLINVYYRAKYTKSVDVIVIAGFQEIEGEMALVTFSLTNSY